MNNCSCWNMTIANCFNFLTLFKLRISTLPSETLSHVVHVPSFENELELCVDRFHFRMITYLFNNMSVMIVCILNQRWQISRCNDCLFFSFSSIAIMETFSPAKRMASQCRQSQIQIKVNTKIWSHIYTIPICKFWHILSK